MPTDETKAAQQPAKSAKGFSDAERDAMRARAQEQKAEARASKNRAEGESAVRAALAAMPEADRVMGERLHAIIAATAPELAPKTWYGMPAYTKDGKVLCFFQCKEKFNTRYAMLGFSDPAHLDDGTMWPVTYALTELTDADEKTIAALVKRAAG